MASSIEVIEMDVIDLNPSPPGVEDFSCDEEEDEKYIVCKNCQPKKCVANHFTAFTIGCILSFFVLAALPIYYLVEVIIL